MKDCDKKNKCGCGVDFASIPASLGDDTGAFAPKSGDYQDTLVKYEANGHIYLFTHDGVPTLLNG